MARYDDLVGEDDWLLASDGRAWVVGDQLHRRAILADAHRNDTTESAARVLFSSCHPSLASTVQRGDFIVAGEHFASDVADKLIAAALLYLGIGAVIARSFGHFFFKNAINLGLPALVVEETGAIQQGDRLRVDIEAHVVANKSSGDRYVIRNLDNDEIAVLRAGGMIAYARGRAPS